ncbi:hypothetical protein [Shimia thalassica]|uniref:hypothetical protein n=1 Tax=Shimia thalassica TaxID=1715693 RepID=UPI0026E33986|nr:hypothetical protein [Shimia thalassica]MDO6480954.1 hypothetical protein [Shimia thalassica]
MAKLGNARHERYAQLVAHGGKKGESYIACGYKATHAKSHASHLAARPDVKARIEELQAKSSAEFMQDGPSMESLGITIPWLAAQYEAVRQQCIKAGDLKTALACVKSVDSLIALEKSLNADKADTKKVGRIDITALSDRLGGILDAATPPATHVNEGATRR